MLYGVGSYDPMAIAGAPLCLSICATAAASFPPAAPLQLNPCRLYAQNETPLPERTLMKGTSMKRKGTKGKGMKGTGFSPYINLNKFAGL